MTNKIFQKKNLVVFILILLLLVPLVYSDIQSSIYTNPDGTPVSIPSSGSPTTTTPVTPSTTPTTTPSTSETNNPLDWIKKNANGVNVVDTKDKSGKVTGSVVTFQNPNGELKLKDSNGNAYSINGIVSEKEGKKATVTLNADGTVQNAQLTVSKDSKTPLYLYVDNTKLEVPSGSSVNYDKDLKKAQVTLMGGKLSQMPQQIDPKKSSDTKFYYSAGEATQLPNGVILQKPEKGFIQTRIYSKNGQDFIETGDAARFNGITAFNPKYDPKENYNQDITILGLRGQPTKKDLTDLTKPENIKSNYLMIDVKDGIFEAGAAIGKTGVIIAPDSENDLIPKIKAESFLALQPRNGGIVQIINQGINKPTLIDTFGEFLASNGNHNFIEKNGKFLIDTIQGIPGVSSGNDVAHTASVPFIMRSYDSNGKEVSKGYEFVMNDNNGYASVPIGTEQAKLSNGDVWRSSLYDRITPGNVPASVPDPTAQPTQPSGKVSDMIMSSSVRIHAQDPGTSPKTVVSTGSGTFIGIDENGNAIIATCAHIFRDWQGGPLNIDTFTPRDPRNPGTEGIMDKMNVPAKLIDADYTNDVALLSVPKNQLGNFISAKLAPEGFNVASGQNVFSAGCSNGAACTVWNEQIVSTNNFINAVGINYLSSSKESIEGRSGGGLFTSSGQLIGVLNAADKENKQSLHEPVDPAIRQMLAKNRITVH